MTMDDDALARLRRHLDKAVRFQDIARSDWRRQTDCLQQVFIAARLFADCGSSAFFIDGHISDYVKGLALFSPLGVKAFFNRRFHDAGFTGRRVIYFDTRMTRKMGTRGSGRHKLHFHGLIELPPGWPKARLVRILERIFGKASPMGQRQFHFAPPRWDQHHTHNDVQIEGPLGKLAYAMSHAGTSYVDLDLNDGKRSRSAPSSRGRYNRKASGLARGIPSNFNADVVFVDTLSKRLGKEAFEVWFRAEAAIYKPPATNTLPSAPTPEKRASA